MRLNGKFFLPVMLLLASGCSTAGPVTEGACAWVKPIYVSESDGLTDGTVRQILAHNETWERNCK